MANSTLVHHLRGGLRIVNIVEAHMVVAGRAWKPARTAQPGTFSRVPVAGRKPYWMMVARRTWFFLISSGIATGLSWLCYFRALQLGEASRVAPIDKLSVIVAIAMAGIFLHEQLTWHHWVGGLFIFTGAVVLARA